MEMINNGCKFETFFYHLIALFSFFIYIDGTEEIEALFFNISQRSIDELLDGKFSGVN